MVKDIKISKIVKLEKQIKENNLSNNIMSVIIKKLKKAELNEIGLTGKFVDMKKELNEFITSTNLNTENLTFEELKFEVQLHKEKERWFKGCSNLSEENQKGIAEEWEVVKLARINKKRLKGKIEEEKEQQKLKEIEKKQKKQLKQKKLLELDEKRRILNEEYEKLKKELEE